MSSVERADYSCAAKPLHRLAARLERETHAALRLELPLIVRLAGDALSVERRRHPELAPQWHLAICQLHAAVTSYFDREEALLFPSIRLIEDGAGACAVDLNLLVRELLKEQAEIQERLGQVRLLTRALVTPESSPILLTLFKALTRLSRDLRAQFQIARDQLYPQALAFEASRTRQTPVSLLRYYQ